MLTPSHPLPARNQAQIIASGICVTRGVTPVLNRLNLTLTPSSRVAVVGENGRGKSTLLQVLAGKLKPDSGFIRRVGTVGLAEQDMNDADGRTIGQAVAEAIAGPLSALAALESASTALANGAEDAIDRYAEAMNRVEALDAWNAERRVRMALEAFGAPVEPDRPLSHLSVGQRFRVRLACLLGADDDFLLLDEPTNHLDDSALEFLATGLRERRGGVVIVSHDRALLSDFAETIIDLDPSSDGQPRMYGGGYAGYREGRSAERLRWEHEFARQMAEHVRLEANLDAAQARLISGWRPEKGSPKHGRATRAGALVQSVHRRQAALDAHAVTIPEPPRALQFPQLAAPSGTPLLAVEGVSVAGRLREPASFSLLRRARLVVSGPNGSGKSTLLAVASGELVPDTGIVRTHDGARIGFLRQESVLPPMLTARVLYDRHVDALVAAGTIPEDRALPLDHLGLLGAGEMAKRVDELSVGQRRRLDLALVLAARPNVLLLDEPTNHLSMTLVDELTDALGATEAAVVVSTHDRQLLRDFGEWQALRLRGRS